MELKLFKMSVAFLPKYSSFKKHFPPIKITLCCCWFFFFYHLCWSSISYTEQKRKRDHFPSVSCPGYSHHPLNEKKQRFFVQTASLDDPHPPEHFKILIPFIHSFSSAYHYQGRRGAGVYPSYQRAGGRVRSMDRSPVCHRATLK